MKAPGRLYVLLPNALAARLGDGLRGRAMKRRSTSDEERKLFEQNFRESAPAQGGDAQGAAAQSQAGGGAAASMAPPRTGCARARLSPMLASTCMA